MNDTPRPRGPIKRYARYFTTPITDVIFAGLKTLSWRTRLDKTEIARRLLDYFLTLPPESQDKLLHSFDAVYERETARLKKEHGKDKPVKVPGLKKAEIKEAVISQPAAPIREIKRSGLP